MCQLFIHCLCFLREFRFTSEVPIWLDYQGKHVVIEQVKGQRTFNYEHGELISVVLFCYVTHLTFAM